MHMRAVALLIAGMLATAAPTLHAQTAPPSDTAPTPPAVTPSSEFPVSIDRIREGLKKSPEQPLLQRLSREADFRVEIMEKARLEAILKKMDFKSGPAPAGGLYGYEQQQRLFSPLDRPLMQPYAAFSGGELITIAMQNLIAKFLGKPLVGALADASRTRAVAAAKEEVDQAIADYCAAQPDRWDIRLCNPDK